MIAVITAGGKGTRLKAVADDIPKPMMPLVAKPVLEHQILSMKESGIDEFIILLGHLGDVIQDYFGDGGSLGVAIEYIQEDRPLGSGGALFYLKDRIKEDFFFVFGDVMLDIDWQRFAKYHKEKACTITLFAHPNSHPFDSDLVLQDESGKAIGFDSKNNVRNYDYQNLVNAGLYVLSPEVFKYFEDMQKRDFEKDIVMKEITAGGVYAYCSSEYVKDMGTPDRLGAVERDFTNGIITAKSYKNKQQAIFLDRDGTINELKGFLKKAEDFQLIEGAGQAIQSINQSKFLAIVITNQPVIARGEATFEELARIHNRMETMLGKEGAYVDGIFFCPHHPDSGFDGEVRELKMDCGCRKPKIGMITEACEKFNIDLGRSWFIGDSSADIMTGRNAGLKTVLVGTGEAGKDGKYDVKPDYETADIKEAVKYILEQNK